jgi:RNA polymerase sigma factor (sigma-70 family)
MSVSQPPGPDVVAAAVAGDHDAVQTLVADHLPLVYNVVGRAASRDLDVDDIVQETMVRVVVGLPDLRDPASFRSWVVSIALRQLVDARRAAATRRSTLDAQPPEHADPGAEFVELTMLREALSHEQREVAEAARWLDDGHRDLLPVWWQEACGRLDRRELAAALGEPAGHVAVRVARMKQQLDTARTVVRALVAVPRCVDLDVLVADWDHTPSPLWRKRIARHLRECTACAGRAPRLIPPERLLAGLPLVVPPPGLGRRALTTRLAAAHGPHLATTTVHTAVRHVARRSARHALLSAGVGPTVAVVASVTALVAAIVVGGILSPSSARATATTAAHLSVPRHAPVSTTSPLPTSSPTAPTTRPHAPATTTAKPGTTVTPTFTDTVPPIPTVRSATDLGAIQQNSRVAGRDDGQSARYGNNSVWIFDDTTLKDPWGFLSNSGAATADLNGADGISLTSAGPFATDTTGAPDTLLPLTAAEQKFQAAHSASTGCTSATDQYCGMQFAFWPGPVIADPAHDRLLVFYGKLCRGGASGTPCSGALGRSLGSGIAALDMVHHTVTRLTATNGPAVTSVEGLDPTMFFTPGTEFTSASLVVDGTAYVYGECTYLGCALGRVALADIADRSRWRFHDSDGTWGTDPTAGAYTIAAGSAGETVFYDAALKAYVNTYMPYGTNTIRYQVGGSPFGPWSASATAVRTVAGSSNNYALFAHPEYAEQHGLVEYLSYFRPSDGSQHLVRLAFDAP